MSNKNGGRSEVHMTSVPTPKKLHSVNNVSSHATIIQSFNPEMDNSLQAKLKALGYTSQLPEKYQQSQEVKTRNAVCNTGPIDTEGERIYRNCNQGPIDTEGERIYRRQLKKPVQELESAPSEDSYQSPRPGRK